MPNTKTTKKETTTTTELFADTNISMKSGNLVYDAETVGDGKFVKIRIASNEQYKDESGDVQTVTNYFNALISKNLTEAFSLAESLKKGDWVYLKGKDQTKLFDTAEGYKKTETTIYAYKVTLKKSAVSKELNQSEPSVS